jgi:hypothetical protein
MVQGSGVEPGSKQLDGIYEGGGQSSQGPITFKYTLKYNWLMLGKELTTS